MNASTSDLAGQRGLSGAGTIYLPAPIATAQRSLARAWLWLGMAALIGSGLFAILLVVSRTPGLQKLFPVADFFRLALVVHVDLSVLVLDGGACEVGIESTILDLSRMKTLKRPVVLRPGAVTPEMIRDVIGEMPLQPEEVPAAKPFA